MPVASRLRFRKNDTLWLHNAHGGRDRYVVLRSRGDGYDLQPTNGDPERTWPHHEIYVLYLDGNLEHSPVNIAALSESLAEVLEASWESWRPELRFEAERRVAYCEYVDRLHKRGVKLTIAWQRSARTVHRQNQRAWSQTANRLAGREDQSLEDSRKPRPCLADPTPVIIDQPSEFAVRDWWRLWCATGRQLKGLIPKLHRRGDHRPRYEKKTHLQEFDDRPLCIYGAMSFIARRFFMRTPRPPRTFAYGELDTLCKERKIDLISYSGFCKFLRKHYDAYQNYLSEHGRQKAFYKFGIFSRREAPEIPLDEVEVDHTLLDVFVMDGRGHVGRPWLTLLIDRATRCVVGIHIGFDVPSYATLSRAVIHAMCVKDLSGIEGIEHDWPCHGVPALIVTDRGLEFLSESFKRAGKLIGFSVLNLPGRCPYLKGTVERFFGTINVRVLSHLEGATYCRDVEKYDPQKAAKYTLTELTQKIVRWIVNDYHQERHPTIGMPPSQRWAEQVALHGVRPIPDVQLLITQLGEIVRRKVGNTGIQYENNTYASPELAELRRRHGGMEKDWQIRIDPYDRGEVCVFNKMGRAWIRVPATHQKTARGYSKYQSRVHMRVARSLVEKGAPVTVAELELAIQQCQEDGRSSKTRQAQRYFADGALATAVHAQVPFKSVANSNELAEMVASQNEQPTVDEAQSSSMIEPSELEHSKSDSTFSGSFEELLAARMKQFEAAA